MKKLKVRVLLDSGAFSAWRKGETIDVKTYMAFIREYRDLIDNYVTLDTIPGSLGRMDRGQESIEKSAAASYKNQCVMRDAGLAPIPVFHQGERFEWLEKYLADKEPYIGISPYLRANQSSIIEWLDQCFTRTTDSRGRPLAKTHGFGATSHEVVWRYPWHSVDSTTWAIAPCYGMLILPAQSPAGGFDLRQPASQFYVGDGAISVPARMRIDHLGEASLNWLHKYAEQCQTSVTGFRNDQYARTAAHIMYFKMLSDQRPEVLFEYKRGSFARTASGTGKPVKVQFRVIFATNLTHAQGPILTRYGAMDRLLSYWNLRDVKELRPRLERYVANGYPSEVEPQSGGELPFLRERSPKSDWQTHSYPDFRRRGIIRRFRGVGGDEQETAT